MPFPLSIVTNRKQLITAIKSIDSTYHDIVLLGTNFSLTVPPADKARKLPKIKRNENYLFKSPITS